MREKIAWDIPMVQIIGTLVIVLIFSIGFVSVSSSDSVNELNIAGEAKNPVQSVQTVASEKTNLAGSEQELGYIIEYVDEPVVAYKSRIEKTGNIAGSAVASQSVRSYASALKVKTLSFDTQIQSSVKKIPKRRYQNTFNGVYMDVTKEEAEKMKSLPFVKAVYPNAKVYAFLNESVPLIGADKVWQLDADGNDCSVSGKECLTGKGIKIAIIDSGVDYTHQDLGGCFGQGCKVAGGYDSFNNDNDPMDDHGHGTHVAATAAGKGILKGVAPDATIYAYKVLNSGGSGTWASVIDGIERSIDPNGDGDFSDRADVISMSLGGNGNPDDPVSASVDNAVEAGVVAVISAGNSGPSERTIGSPGTARKAITIGATDKNDKIASFSSRGPVVWVVEKNKTNVLIKPDVVAPGVSICAAEWDSAWSNKKCLDDKHIAISGTSMAAPHVSGLVALIKQKNPDWTPDEIKMSLRSTAVDLNQEITSQGYGRIDPLKAAGVKNKPSFVEVRTGGLVKGLINIEGTASGKDFAGYRLLYGARLNPDSWMPIVSGNSIINGIIYENFDTTNLADGRYLLRLEAENSGGFVSIDENLIEIDNVKLEISNIEQILPVNKKIEIKGSVFCPEFQNYTIEYNSGNDDTLWSSKGIYLQNEGKNQVDNSLLATWDTTILNTNLFYALRITANCKNNNEFLIKNIQFESKIRDGWPQYIDYYKSPETFDIESLSDEALLSASRNYMQKIYPSLDVISAERNDNTVSITAQQGNNYYKMNSDVRALYVYWAGLMEPVVDDINNDGIKEILYYKGGNPVKIFAYEPDGTFLKGWPVDVNEDLPGGNLNVPTIADLDGDNFKEVIVNGMRGLYIYNHRGELIKLLPLDVGIDSTTVVADSKIIKEYYGGTKFIVLDNKGDALPGWPQNIYNTVGPDGRGYTCLYIGDPTAPAVGNFDNDPELEIAVLAIRNTFDNPADPLKTWRCRGNVFAFNMDGSIINGFPVELPQILIAPASTADIDKNGQDEIFTASDDGVYAIDGKGQIVNGWPVLPDSRMYSGAIAFADFEKDGSLEIIAVGWELFYAAAFEKNGILKQGWPVYVGGSRGSPIVINANDGLKIIFSNLQIIKTLDSYGQLEDIFKSLFTYSSPAVYDLDGDGSMEIVSSSDMFSKQKVGLFVYNTNYTGNGIWPTLQHDPQHTGCYDCEKQEPRLSLIIPSSAAAPNVKITITGTGFTKQGNDVAFCTTGGNVSACISEINQTSNTTHIYTTVPQLSPGLYDVFVSNINGKSNSLQFTILPSKKNYTVSFISVAAKDGMATSNSVNINNDFSNIGSTPQGVRRAFIYFDTSSIPANAEIKSAKLTVKGYNFAKSKCTTTGNVDVRICNFDPLDKTDFSACLQNAKNSAFINLPETGGAQKVTISIDPILVSKQGGKSSATQHVLISQNEACKTGKLGNFARICSDIKSKTSWLECKSDADRPVLEVSYSA